MKTATRTWFPLHGQLGLTDASNTTRLHSLWVGLTAPILNLPTLVWVLILSPMLNGFVNLFNVFALSAYYGVTGQMIGVDTSEAESSEQA
jgi:hypothetical protein